jgi:hypothetical protein
MAFVWGIWVLVSLGLTFVYGTVVAIRLADRLGS